MATGTIGVFFYGLQTGEKNYALTLAFTTFVLFQFFNVFNARTEHGTAFNRQFFANGKLWASLLGWWDCKWWSCTGAPPKPSSARWL